MDTQRQFSDMRGTTEGKGGGKGKEIIAAIILISFFMVSHHQRGMAINLNCVSLTFIKVVPFSAEGDI